jgi:CheY-like chemotaxis protein
LGKLDQVAFDVVVASLDLPSEGALNLVAKLRSRQEWKHIPVLALADSVAEARVSNLGPAAFRDCQAKFDGILVLESVARMVLSPAAVEDIAEYAGEKS